MDAHLEYRSSNSYDFTIDKVMFQQVKLEVPNQQSPLSVGVETLIRENIEVYDDFVYYYRIPEPTEASVFYSSAYILRLLKETQVTCFVLNLTDREIINHHLRRITMKCAVDIIPLLKDVVIILDDNPFRNVIIDFLARVYLYKTDVKVQLCPDQRSAFEYIQGRVSSTKSKCNP